MTKRKKINLALQGGGAHGAFTRGVLDRFLETELFDIEGISATSAGSMNAVIVAQGLLEGGTQGARQLLHDFWKAMSDYGTMFGVTAKSPMDIYLEPFLKAPVNFSVFNAIIGLLSPYQFNPLNFHPIREVLNKIIDIEKIKKQSTIKLFICATNVKTGKIRIFNEEELTVDTLLASACLPKLFQAVEVEGELYWDGGYLGNPAIFPLIYNTNCQDIIVVHTIPSSREEIPNTVAEIDMRLREISFNSSLMREMRAIAFVSRLVDQGAIKKEFAHTLKKLHMHCIKTDKGMNNLSLSTIYSPDWDFLITLRDLGRNKADEWLKENYAFIGKSTTVDFDEWL